MGFFTESERATVVAAADRLVPPVDGHPGAAALGVVDYIDGLLDAFAVDPPRIWAGGPYSGRAGGDAQFGHFLELSPLEALAWRTRIEGSLEIPERERLGPVIGWQDHYRTSLAALGADFAGLDPDEQDARLDALADFRVLLYEHVVEGAYAAPEYLGNRDLGGWTAIGFPGDVQPRGYTDEEVEGRGVSDAGREWDAVVIGTGPAGATAAEVLTAAGWSVLMLEKGRNHLLDLDAPYGPLGHVSNDELKFMRRHFLGPDPWLEPRTFRRGDDDGDHLEVGDVNNLPSTVGGGGFHADGKLPRFRADDFKPVSAGGPVDGAALTDWPVDYDEMEPYYAAAERVVGVAGDAGANPFASWRADPYPMPPGADMYCAVITAEAATRAGYHPYRAPTGVNSVEYDGRPACNNCGFCGYFGCPIDAKGDPVAPLRHALRTGNCEIRTESIVTDVLLDGSGHRARGVRYLDTELHAHEVSARHVVLAGGAFETPRLLLRTGLGNPDVVGRYLQFHFQTYVLGMFPERLHGHRGRSVTHLMDDPIVPDELARAAARDAGLPFIRGGIVEHGAAGHPILEGIHLPHGELHSQLMLQSMTRDCMAVFTMQGEDLPQADNRIDLDPSVRDVYGLPAGRVTYAPHRHEVVCAEHWAPRLETVMRDAGATATFWTTSPPLPGSMADRPGGRTPISRHIMGGARMGEDPATSVFDPWQRLHGIENVLCTDSSVFPTSTGYGPTLTIVALAIRASRALAGLDPLRSARPDGA